MVNIGIVIVAIGLACIIYGGQADCFDTSAKRIGCIGFPIIIIGLLIVLFS